MVTVTTSDCSVNNETHTTSRFANGHYVGDIVPTSPPLRSLGLVNRSPNDDPRGPQHKAKDGAQDIASDHRVGIPLPEGLLGEPDDQDQPDKREEEAAHDEVPSSDLDFLLFLRLVQLHSVLSPSVG